MSVRLLLTDEAWAEIAPILAAINSRAGSPPALSERMCIEAVLYLARGPPLARPARRVWALGRSLEPLASLGSSGHLARALGTSAGGGVPRRPGPLSRCAHRARPSACRWGVKKNGGQAAQALGRSRGGLATTIHAGGVDAQTGVARVLTAGQRHERPVLDAVLAHVPHAHTLTHAMMDKAYDSEQIRTTLTAHDVVPVIPPQSTRTAARASDRDLYKWREKIERFFNNLKQCRRSATRYEKLSQTCLAFLHLVAAWISI